MLPVYLVVVAFGIERRIDITKINRLVADKLPYHIKIVTLVEFVHWDLLDGNVALTALIGKKCGGGASGDTYVGCYAITTVGASAMNQKA